jgi:hypothetical protein
MATNRELLDKYEASTDSVEVEGTWRYRGRFYRLVRITVDAPNPKKASAFSERLKGNPEVPF